MTTNKRAFRNRLNDLSPKEWIKFQKSWFIHDPPPRRKDVLRHPAKFPETMAESFIRFFTKRGQSVLDPMAGTGSTLIACLRSGRHGYGIELNDSYAELGRSILSDERERLGEEAEGLTSELFTGDAAQLQLYKFPLVDYILTSPPYWDMLHARGSETQKKRRGDQTLDVTYSEDPQDLGNIRDYDAFLSKLVGIYQNLGQALRPGAYITIIVKNVKKGGQIYPLAWDLASRLRDFYQLKDEKIWCQDNVRLAPYGMGNAWVSNTHHHYCLQFRNPSVV